MYQNLGQLIKSSLVTWITKASDFGKTPEGIAVMQSTSCLLARAAVTFSRILFAFLKPDSRQRKSADWIKGS